MVAKSYRTPGSFLLDAGLASALMAALGVVFATDLLTQKREPIVPPPAAPATEEPPSAPPPPPPPPPVLVAAIALPEPPAPPPPAPIVQNTSEIPPAPLPLPPEKVIPTDLTKQVFPAFGHSGARFGVRTKTGKKLTFSEFGNTGNTQVAIDKSSEMFGSGNGVAKRWPGPTGGPTHTVNDPKKVGGDQKTVAHGLPENGPYYFTWKFKGIEFEQSVDYVLGPTSRKMDTILVKYTLTNQGANTHSVGLRVLLDTYIGAEDGVPFYVPGQQGLVQKGLILDGTDVPEYVLALEKPNFDDPGTVVQLTLGAQNTELPITFVLSRFPQRALRGGGYEPDPDAPWNWKPQKGAPFKGDSAVGFYYAEKPLKPQASRTFSYTYGLGSLSSTESRNSRLSLNAGGSLEVGKKFWLMALVNPARNGQKVEIILPSGLTLAQGETASKTVSMPDEGGPSQQTWLVSINGDAGSAPVIKVRLTPDGVEESYTVPIQNPQQSLRLATSGVPQAASPIWIAANLQHAKPGQQVTLTLPPGCRLDPRAGNDATQMVPAVEPAQVKWLVIFEPTASGSLTFKAATKPEGVEASTAITVKSLQTTMRLVASASAQAGGKVWIAANLQNAKPGQQVRLDLPSGVRFEPGHEATQTVPATDPAQLKWLVSVPTTVTGSITFTATTAPDGVSDTTRIEVKPFKPQVTLSIPGDRDPEAGKKFWVAVQVTPQVAGMTAELSLPPGLSLSGDRGASQTLKEEPGFGWAQWLVEAQPSAAGRAELRVSVTGGETKSKTIEIRPASIVR